MGEKHGVDTVRITASELQLRRIDELVPYANNARIHGEAQIQQLRASLREFGFVTPVLIDAAGNVIAGHGRLMAARAEGMEEVPCVLVEGLTEAQRKAYILAENRLEELGQWDKAILKIELDGLDALDFGTETLGFDQDFLADLFLEAGPEDATENENGHFWEDEGESNDEYEEFVEKFKPKLTTDDCYTPANVYEAVKIWAVRRYGLEGREIVRPFFPGGDYEKHKYPAGCVVIDNPPFSILSAICRFYRKKEIDFFLFAPGLTLFSTGRGEFNYVLAGGNIEYENGANVQTSFVTSLGEYKIETAPDLADALEKAIKENRKGKVQELPGYVYPMQVIRSADYTLSKYGQKLCIKPEDAMFVRHLDEQKVRGKAIFGGGFLLSEKAAAEKTAAEKAAAEMAAAEMAAAHVWELSEREQKLVASLGKG